VEKVGNRGSGNTVHKNMRIGGLDFLCGIGEPQTWETVWKNRHTIDTFLTKSITVGKMEQRPTKGLILKMSFVRIPVNLS
jgi:hypothetical protein